MSRVAISLGLSALLLALSGCSVTMVGQQTTGGGSSVTNTASSVRGSTNFGNARISGSFGTPPARYAPGGQATLTGNASAVLVTVLVIAGLMEMVDDWLQPAAAGNEAPGGRNPAESISHTCSCYGWQPETAPASARQQDTGF